MERVLALALGVLIAACDESQHSSSFAPMAQPIRSDVSIGRVHTKSTSAATALVSQTAKGAFWQLGYAAQTSDNAAIYVGVPHADSFPTGTFDVKTYSQASWNGPAKISVEYTRPTATDASANDVSGSVAATYRANAGTLVVSTADNQKVIIEFNELSLVADGQTSPITLDGDVTSEIDWFCEVLGTAGAHSPIVEEDGSTPPVQMPEARGQVPAQPNAMLDPDWSSDFCRAQRSQI